MSNKNIKQNHFLQIKKILDEVDKAGENADHFRCCILMGDSCQPQAYSYMHAPQEDIENMILHGLESSEVFAYSVAKAVEAYCNKHEAESDTQSKTDTDEKNQI